jgi:hypothetical protein
MTQHDKHQYYFEKYLRNEMPEDERLALNEQLEADSALRMAFEYYKLNRQQLLEQLIEEHKLARRDNRLNKLIFLLISLTGIALTFNYFLYKDDNANASKKEDSANVIIRYIPFLDWKGKNEKKSEPAKQNVQVPTDTAEITKDEPIEQLEPSVDGNERLLSDHFLADTFVSILDKSNYELLISQAKDSLRGDSLPVKKAVQNPNPKTKKLLVEFWQSPVKYSGYLYADNKLVLYGISYPGKIYIYKGSDHNIVVLPFGEYPLIEQTKFTQF